MAIVNFILVSPAHANSDHIRFLYPAIDISDSIVEAYVNEENTKAIVIVQADSLIIEHCFADGGEVTKYASPLFDRLISIRLLETALNEGNVYSDNEPVCKYLPELPEKEFSSLSLADFLNLGPEDSKSFTIPETILKNTTSGNDTF
jgi:hypothetical protein